MTTSGATRISCFVSRWFSRIRTGAREGGAGIAALFYPPQCVTCGAPVAWGEVLCATCEEHLPGRVGPHCDRCGDLLDDERVDLCLRCGTHLRGFERAISLGPYDGGWRTLIALFKFDREKAVGRWLGLRLADAAARSLSEVACVTHVPMTRAERKARGGNPSQELARVVARRLRAPERSLLQKTRTTRPQRTLPARERAVNLRGAFRGVRSGTGTVLLVDDLLTTGATVDECGRVLKSEGYSEVYVLTVVRA
ncbi:MAG: ComF family protein [Candidatus Bipolaricaulota bacterium]|nr:ComF family protein [Candidatus Bipolaricaulota bacterium]